jgi:hypothetical protein
VSLLVALSCLAPLFAVVQAAPSAPYCNGGRLHGSQSVMIIKRTIEAGVGVTNFSGTTCLLSGAPAMMFDPNNHNFVYLRWQRGIMHFNIACSCTQGILLADYLKSILTGQNLPADLSQESMGSPFYKQYDPAALNRVHNPATLPDTSMINAFAPG